MPKDRSRSNPQGSGSFTHLRPASVPVRSLAEIWGHVVLVQRRSPPLGICTSHFYQ